MRLQARDFHPVVKRSGVHTVQLHFGGQYYKLTDAEARTLATDLLKTVDPQGE